LNSVTEGTSLPLFGLRQVDGAFGALPPTRAVRLALCLFDFREAQPRVEKFKEVRTIPQLLDGKPTRPPVIIKRAVDFGLPIGCFCAGLLDDWQSAITIAIIVDTFAAFA